MNLLGWKYLDFDEEKLILKVEMRAGPEFINPAGFIHGGMLAAMLDETLAPTVAAVLAAGEFAPSLELKVNFISPAKVGKILGTGKVISKGTSICFAEAQLHDERGALLATASSTSKISRSVKPKSEHITDWSSIVGG
ncbi:uncharacterized protein (TIGR00369 family) [Bradyrhizobium macuxiense]|uniref:Uncharacterized protein (TIGR00369 family) n=2 Tax=Bradyrhizobium macuxiense TaxID=1755647 RepID=A0A560KXA2_9BRAD|nr:uncharacterized protein (TIGR00369 family) [Bradyrhizobium macuxiense]